MSVVQKPPALPQQLDNETLNRVLQILYENDIRLEGANVQGTKNLLDRLNDFEKRIKVLEGFH